MSSLAEQELHAVKFLRSRGTPIPLLTPNAYLPQKCSRGRHSQLRRSVKQGPRHARFSREVQSSPRHKPWVRSGKQPSPEGREKRLSDTVPQGRATLAPALAPGTLAKKFPLDWNPSTVSLPCWGRRTGCRRASFCTAAGLVLAIATFAALVLQTLLLHSQRFRLRQLRFWVAQRFSAAMSTSIGRRL
jgi:hypothetical protein